ncbi:MAG: hypothetical protein C0591_07505 [Marinilabiliales bacterium]|jgi:hypothetical protein|nr:MAG: hypothetical protein C0591_07505 [Marinilabiliales bacterium]
MKKYIILSIIAALFLNGCVKDELPAPGAPDPENYSDIVINELCPKDITDPYFLSANGDPADWVELYNKGNQSVNIAGMWITDKPGEESEYQQIPDNHVNVTTIPPKGFVVLICGATNSGGQDIMTSIVDGKIFIDMGISATNDNTIAIYDPEKTLIDQSGDFNGLEEDKSYGRTTDGGSEWATLASKTPGASNDGSAPVAGTVVINEFMCSNDVTVVPDGHPDDYPDWLELYNTGDTPIDIGGWYFTDDMADPMQYQVPADIPDQTVIPGHGYLLLYCCGLGEGIHLSFKLGSGGDDIGMSQDGVTFVDAVTYGSGSGDGTPVPTPETDYSTGRQPDGSFNWVVFDPNTATPPTPGAPNAE